MLGRRLGRAQQRGLLLQLQLHAGVQQRAAAVAAAGVLWGHRCQVVHQPGLLGDVLQLWQLQQ
jgi:hypothetical protein